MTLTPSISNTQRTILAGKTSAKQNVSWKLGSARPFLLYNVEGGSQRSVDKRRRQKRVQYTAYSTKADTGYSQAEALMSEVDAVLVPPERIVHGFMGQVGDVFIWNVERVVESYWLPDPETGEHRFIAVYEFSYNAMPEQIPEL